jgi:hypothetical protein
VQQSRSASIFRSRQPTHWAPVNCTCDNEFVTQYSHLSHVINGTCNDDDVYNRNLEFTAPSNNLLCNFSCLDPTTKTKLFQSYCCSHCGCEIWVFSHAKMDKYRTAWRKALQRTWDLPHDYRSDNLSIIYGCTSLYDEYIVAH